MADNINEEKMEQEEQDIEYTNGKDEGIDLDDSVVAEEAQTATIKKLRDSLKKALAEKQEYLTSWQKDKAEFINARKRDEARYLVRRDRGRRARTSPQRPAPATRR